jgi:hypothetical protein
MRRNFNLRIEGLLSQPGPSRRTLLASLPAVGVGAVLGAPLGSADDVAADPGAKVPPGSFPRQADDVVEEVVRFSHFDVDEVRVRVEARPALARASWDWGFGDWESALGAASHMGRPDIAEVLMEHGARPNIFTAAMMGWLDVVRSMVAARPGIQNRTGPHGITLLAHARAGGENAALVAEWLVELGGADPTPTMVDHDASLYVGTYRFGSGDSDVLVLDVNRRKMLAVRRPGQTKRALVPAGPHTFFPEGVPSVRIEFEIESAAARALSIRDGLLDVRAVRSPDFDKQ